MRVCMALTAATGIALALAGGCADSTPKRPSTHPAGIYPPTASMPAEETPAASIASEHELATLDDYLFRSAADNPSLEAAFHRWKAALDRIPQARALEDPRFTYRYFIEAQAMRDGDMSHTFEIQQMVPWLEKLRLRAEVADQEARARQQEFEAEKTRLFARVKQAYYEYYYLHRAIDITQTGAEQVRAFEEIARRRYQTSAGAAGDVYRAQIERDKIDNELASLRDLRQPTAARLNAAMNLPLDTELPAPRRQEFATVSLDPRQLMEWLEQSNPELAAMEHMVQREQRSAALAGQDYFPDVMVGFEYDLMTSAAGMNDGDMKNPMALMVGLSVPIWWDKYAAEVREAQSRRFAAHRDKLAKKNSLLSDLKLVAYNFRNSQRKAVLYRDSLVPKARQSLQSVQASYQTGSAIFSDLIEAHRMLLEFQLNQERAEADCRQSLAEMEMLVGRSFQPTAASTQSAPTSEPAVTP